MSRKTKPCDCDDSLMSPPLSSPMSQPVPEPQGRHDEFLVRPNFFSGQMLTRDDLTQAVEYGRQRLGLQRYRTGWGAVCGLNVIHDKEAPLSVVVKPGYAVDSAGNDIVLCDPFPIDLTPYLLSVHDPCGVAETTTFPTLGFNGIRYRGQLLDVAVCYTEEKCSPRNSVPNERCNDRYMSDFSRIAETAQFTVTQAIRLTEDKTKYEACPSAMDWLADQWRNEFTEWLGKLEEGIKKMFEVQENETGKAYADRVRDMIRQQPPKEFWFINEWLSTEYWNPSAPGEMQLPANLIFWLVQDRLNSYLRCMCGTVCQPESKCVPLARVWIGWRDGKDEPGSVIAISNYSPHRRQLNSEVWPARVGQVNVAQFVWHTLAEVERIAADKVLHLSLQSYTSYIYPKTMQEIGEWLGQIKNNLFNDPHSSGSSIELMQAEYIDDSRVTFGYKRS